MRDTNQPNTPKDIQAHHIVKYFQGFLINVLFIIVRMNVNFFMTNQKRNTWPNKEYKGSNGYDNKEFYLFIKTIGEVNVDQSEET